jgi:hypothetical protein
MWPKASMMNHDDCIFPTKLDPTFTLERLLWAEETDTPPHLGLPSFVCHHNTGWCACVCVCVTVFGEKKKTSEKRKRHARGRRWSEGYTVVLMVVLEEEEAVVVVQV